MDLGEGGGLLCTWVQCGAAGSLAGRLCVEGERMKGKPGALLPEEGSR